MERPHTVSSLREAVAHVVAALDSPISRPDLARRVQTLHPSFRSRPPAQILGEVRRQSDLVRLDDGRLAPPQWVLRGVRFRFTPSPQDARSGIVPLFPCFIPFLLDAEMDGPLHLTLRDAVTDEIIPWLPFSLHGSLHETTAAGAESTVRFQALSLHDWMRECGFLPGDSLLLTLADPVKAVFHIAHERAVDADRAAIAIQDATLEAVLVALVEKNPSDQIFLEEIIPAALARLHEARCAYPGSHWFDVVKRSPALRLIDDYAIARATYLRPIDRLVGYAASPAARRRLENRIDDYSAEVRRVLERLPFPPPMTVPVRRERDDALRRSAEQITQFLGNDVREDSRRCLAVPAVYLARHEGVSLAEADLHMLCRFLFSYYPRRVLFNRKRFTARMLSMLRHFYAAQGAALPRSLSRLHALVDRKIALLVEIDQEGPDSARLFARLFPDADGADAEMHTLSFAQPLAQN